MSWYDVCVVSFNKESEVILCQDKYSTLGLRGSNARGQNVRPGLGEANLAEAGTKCLIGGI